jgi:hypothetical protein
VCRRFESSRGHKQRWTQTSAARHAGPRIFATTAPREALLARIDSNGESEIIVDPALRGYPRAR